MATVITYWDVEDVTLSSFPSGQSNPQSVEPDASNPIPLYTNPIGPEGFTFREWKLLSTSGDIGITVGDTIISIPPSSTSYTIAVLAVWVPYPTPGHAGYDDSVDILTSRVYATGDGYMQRVLFGSRLINGTPTPAMEVRDANNGEFISDYTTMNTATINTATVGQLRIGNYVLTPHTQLSNNDSLALEYKPL